MKITFICLVKIRLQMWLNQRNFRRFEGTIQKQLNFRRNLYVTKDPPPPPPPPHTHTYTHTHPVHGRKLFRNHWKTSWNLYLSISSKYECKCWKSSLYVAYLSVKWGFICVKWGIWTLHAWGYVGTIWQAGVSWHMRSTWNYIYLHCQKSSANELNFSRKYKVWRHNSK